MERIALPPFPRPHAAPPADAGLAAAGLTLRAASRDDLPLLARLYAAFRMPELLLAPWSAAEKQAFVNDQFRLQHVHLVRHFPRADYWIVERDGAAIGRLYLDRARAEWRVLDILLEPAAQGTGIGTALLRWVQDRAVAAGAGAAAVALQVTFNNPRAQALYRRLGFEDVADPDGNGLNLPMRWPAIRP